MKIRKVVGIIALCVVCMLLASILTACWVFSSIPLPHTDGGGIVDVTFSVSNITAKVNKSVTFNASHSNYAGPGLPDNIPRFIKDLPSLFFWDFDDSDGFQIETEGVIVNHTYTEPGTYNVTLMIVIYPASDGSSSVRYVGSSERTITVVE